MLAPFTRLAVSSLADFSARLPQGTPSDATNEGIAVQCFQKVLNRFETIQTARADHRGEGLA